MISATPFFSASDLIGTWVVTKTRSPQIVTPLIPASGKGVRQRTFSFRFTLHSTGGVPSTCQLPLGPAG